MMNFKPDDIVKSCKKLECGLRFGQEGVHACQLGPFSSPLFWTAEEAANLSISKEMIVEKRRRLFETLNDKNAERIPCKGCDMVKLKPFKEVDFGRLGHIDLAATTICNLRCSFCGYTKRDLFAKAKYDALAILKLFSKEDVEWDAAVDFNGGEPALLPDLTEYLDYFSSRRIRVFLYSNAVKFRREIGDGLKNGSISWVCVSLDAGTPSTFERMKHYAFFPQVLENLTRYAGASGGDGGKLAVKYIFCEDNLGDDDLYGFAYAMLAIRPQEVWLTFDFEPLAGLPPDAPGLGGADYSKGVAAYAKLFLLLKKHGVDPIHFLEKHLAPASRHGKTLLDMVKAEIAKSPERETTNSELLLKNFRLPPGQEEPVGQETSFHPAKFSLAPLRAIKADGGAVPWSLLGKRVAIAPTCVASVGLLDDPEIRAAKEIHLLDRDRVLQGKKIQGASVVSYENLEILCPDVILVVAPEAHRAAILRNVLRHVDEPGKIAVLDSLP